MEKIKQITQWYVSTIISVVFGICAAVYFYAVKGLEKPAGLVEAFKFMFTSPKEYALCLLCGGVAKASSVAMIVIAVFSILLVVAIIYRYKVEDEWFDVKEIILYIVNCVLAIIMAIIQANIVSYFWLLLLAIVLIIIVIKIYADNS